MGCPYMDGASAPSAPASNEYPYEELYRPWSWMFSSFGNVFALLLIIWFLFRLRRSRRKAAVISYRRVVVKKIEDEENKARAVVIGGLGFVGRSLVKHLIRDGRYHVHVLDSKLPDEDCHEDGVCSYVRCDLTNVDNVEMALRETTADVVFHTASMDPTLDIKYLVTVSERGSENILLACQRASVKRLIYTSSVATVVGDRFRNYENIDENLPYPDEPCTSYSAGMAAAEELLLAKDGLQVCALRAGTVYGADPLLFKSYQSPSLSHSKMDVISVDYFAQAHIIADQKLRTDDISGKAYFISGETVSSSEFCSFGYNQTVSGLQIWSKWVLSCLSSVIHGSPSVLLIDVLLQLPSYTIDGSLAVKELGLEKPSSWKKSVKEYLVECQKSYQ